MTNKERHLHFTINSKKDSINNLLFMGFNYKKLALNKSLMKNHFQKWQKSKK